MQVDSAAEGELMLGALEAGTHGVVLRTGSAAEVGMDRMQWGAQSKDAQGVQPRWAWMGCMGRSKWGCTGGAAEE